MYILSNLNSKINSPPSWFLSIRASLSSAFFLFFISISKTPVVKNHKCFVWLCYPNYTRNKCGQYSNTSHTALLMAMPTTMLAGSSTLYRFSFLFAFYQTSNDDCKSHEQHSSYYKCSHILYLISMQRKIRFPLDAFLIYAFILLFNCFEAMLLSFCGLHNR